MSFPEELNGPLNLGSASLELGSKKVGRCRPLKNLSRPSMAAPVIYACVARRVVVFIFSLLNINPYAPNDPSK